MVISNLFNLPELVLPNTLEVFEPEHGENVKTTFRVCKVI